MSPDRRTNAALVLNNTLEPLHITTAGNALVHVLMGKATSVLDSPYVAHSQHLDVPFPSVIMLNQYVNEPRAGRKSIPINRRTVIARDRGRCAYCLGPAEEIEHILPRAQGGKHTWENVVAPPDTTVITARTT